MQPWYLPSEMMKTPRLTSLARHCKERQMIASKRDVADMDRSSPYAADDWRETGGQEGAAHNGSHTPIVVHQLCTDLNHIHINEVRHVQLQKHVQPASCWQQPLGKHLGLHKRNTQVLHFAHTGTQAPLSLQATGSTLPVSGP